MDIGFCFQSYIPDLFKLRQFVSTPPPACERLFCTMIHHGEETSGGHYTLYLEYLGGLIPLLKGKRTSKLRPDFIIFDPKIKPKRKDGGCNEAEISVTPSVIINRHIDFKNMYKYMYTGTIMLNLIVVLEFWHIYALNLSFSFNIKYRCCSC